MSNQINKCPYESDKFYDPSSKDFIKDPYPYYEQIHKHENVFYSQYGFWVVCDYEMVQILLKDRRFEKQFERQIVNKYERETILDEPCYAMMRHWMLVVNPPAHTRLRKLVHKAFTSRNLRAMTPKIETIVKDCIERVRQKGEMDFVKDFAYRIPAIVISDMLGIPKEHQDEMLEKAVVPHRIVDPTPLTKKELEEANDNVLFLKSYFIDLCEEKRKTPDDSLVSALLQSEEEEDKLSLQEIISNIYLLYFAGHETTMNLIANGFLALHQNPQHLAYVMKHPEILPQVVDELLRYNTSVQMTGYRAPIEDLDINGHSFKKGELILPLVGAALHDPKQFSNPEKLDFFRPKSQPIAFGGGIHFCLGAQLAKLETEIAYKILFEELPNIKIKNIHKPQWKKTFVLRGLSHLNCVF